MAMPHPQRAQDPGDLTGSTVGRFRVDFLVGAGGMGEVYCAEDSALKRRVALKRIAPALRADPHVVHQFRREAQRASALSHPCIAAIYDILEENGEVLLVLEYVEGETLRSRCQAPISIGGALRILRQCAEALVAAHDKQVVHLDLKPENIMETAEGKVKVLDFGVAHRLDQTEATATTDSMLGMGGTLAYMAPEQLLGHGVDARADIFALGVVGYEMLAGRHPFRGENWGETLDRTLHAEPVPLHELNPAVWPQLEQIIQRMLAKDVNARYASARELLQDLHVLEREGSAATTILVPPVPRPKWRTWFAAAAALLLLLAAVLLLVGRDWIRQVPDQPLMPARKHVAVLPFRVIGNPELQSYSDGLMDTVTTRLTKFTDPDTLGVVSAGEVRALKVKTVDEARKELGANLVLEGSLQRAGDSVRVAFALIDAATRRQVRADAVTASAADPFQLEDSVAAAVMRILAVEQKPGVAPASRATKVNGAYEYYLRGQGALLEYDNPDNVGRAASDFTRAIALDGNFALAYAARGQATWASYKENRQPNLVEIARHDCARAVQLDPTAAAAHVCLASVEDATGHYKQAAAEFERALDQDPGNDAAYRGLGSAYEHLGKFQEAERTYVRAIRLRPQYWAGYNWLGAFYMKQSRYADAAEQFKKAALVAPENSRPHSNLGGAYVLMGRYEDAVPQLQQAIDLRPNPAAYSNLGLANFHLRRFDQAVAAYEQAYRLNSADFLYAGNLAETYFWAPGKRAESHKMFQRAIDLGEKQIAVDPRDGDTLSELAKWYAYQAQKKPALDHLQRALSLQPNNATVLFNGAIVHNLLGDRSAALALLKKALALGYSRAQAGAAIEFENLKADPAFLAIRATNSPKKGD